MIRSARCRHPGDESKGAESFLVLDWLLLVKADDSALAFDLPG
jgi:hypothetical protein